MLARCATATHRLFCIADLLSGVDNPVNIDYIEELIFRQEPFLRVVRLLCLLSLTTGGLKPKVLESFRREIIQVGPTARVRLGGLRAPPPRSGEARA